MDPVMRNVETTDPGIKYRQPALEAGGKCTRDKEVSSSEKRMIAVCHKAATLKLLGIIDIHVDL